MPRTPKRLVGPLQLAAAAATLYTVPSATKTVIREIVLSNPDTSAHTVTLSIGADAASTRFMGSYNIPAAAAGVTGSRVIEFHYLVMETTEILQGFADAATKVVIVVTGDELTLG